MITLPKEQLRKLSDRLQQEIDASENARGSLPERWKKTRALYNNEKDQSTLNVVDGVEPYALPIYRAKADRIADSTIKTFTAVHPYVQVIDESGQSTNNELYERSLMCLAEYCTFKRTFRRAFVECMNTDLGVMRVRPLVGENGLVGSIVSERIKPEFMIGYPTYVSTFDDCSTVGHKFPQSIRDIKRKQKDKIYLEGEVVQTSTQEFLDANVSYQMTSQDSLAAVDDEYDMSPVRCYELITDEKIKGEWKKILVTYAYDTNTVLSIQEYDYPIHWYVTMRIDDEDDTLWPNNSLGQRVQALNQIFSDGNSTLFIGSLASAFPLVAIKGGTLGREKYKKYTPAMMVELPAGAEMQVVATPFNPGAMPMALQKIEEMVDAVMGISRMGTGQALPSETREAAINGILQAQQESKEGYADAVSPAVKKFFQLLDLYLVSHFWDLKAAYGNRIPIQDPSEIPTTYRLEVTGQNTSSSPQALNQKLGSIYQISQNPTSDRGADLESFFPLASIPSAASLRVSSVRLSLTRMYSSWDAVYDER